jgi:hypothetical protein
MHPTLVAKPFHRDGWVYEEKVDGWRMLAMMTSAAYHLRRTVPRRPAGATATNHSPSPLMRAR